MSDTKYSLLCDCGCANGFTIQAIDGEAYISFFSSDFTAKQRPCPLHRLKDVITSRIKYGKKENLRILKEIIVRDEKEIEEFEKFLEENATSDDSEHNESEIEIFWDDDFGYVIMLVSKYYGVANIAARLHHGFRLYDLVINREEKKRMLRKIRKARNRKEQRR